MQRLVSEIIAEGGRTFSFEFFPPKTDAGEAVLWRSLRELEALAPDFVSVTYGAGGSTRARTVDITRRIMLDTDLNAVGHLTCVGATTAELREVVDEYRVVGVHNILALRGDPAGGPSAEWTATSGGLDHADELVRLVADSGSFDVGVAAFPDKHPASPSLEFDADVLRRKQDAGASYAITQFFFEASAYERLVELAVARGCTIPIIPGIMPVTDVGQIERFAKLSGADFPLRLAQRFHAVADDPESVRRLGVETAGLLADHLLALGAPGLHFYTLNRSTATRDIYRALGLAPSVAPVDADVDNRHTGDIS